MEYYITIEGRTVGPMTKEQIFAYKVTEKTPVSVDGGEWAPLFTFPELQQLLAAGRSVGNCGQTDKDKTAAGVLAILIGTLGIHYFYIGKTEAGIFTILLSLVTCGLWGIITLIQGIIMLTMSQEEFEHKYVLSPSKFPIF